MYNNITAMGVYASQNMHQIFEEFQKTLRLLHGLLHPHPSLAWERILASGSSTPTTPQLLPAPPLNWPPTSTSHSRPIVQLTLHEREI